MPNKLSDLQIDEISLVYKGANQHSRVAIAKSFDGQQEETVEIYDQAGNPVDPDTLEVGDIVFNDEGEAFQYTDEDEDDTEDADEYEPELETVGKGIGSALKTVGANIKGTGQAAGGYAKNTVAPWAKKNKSGLIAGGATGLALGGVGGSQVKKNFGAEVRSELSKALSDDERDAVIAKAFDYVEYLETVAKSAEEVAKSEREARRQSEYLEIAKSYSFPVSDEELASAFMAIEDNLDPEQVATIAKCFSAASDALFEELGQQGGGSNYSPVMDAIEQYANNDVAKSADANSAVAISKAFQDDPSLYDRYLSETGNYNR